MSCRKKVICSFVVGRISVRHVWSPLDVVMTEKGNLFMVSLCSHFTTHTLTGYIKKKTLLYVASFAFLSPALSDHSSCDNQGTRGCFITCWDSKAMNEDVWIYTWMLLLPLPSRLRFCLCYFYCDIGPFLVRDELQCRRDECVFVFFAKIERILMKCASGLEIMHRNTWIEIVAWSSSYLTSWIHSAIITVNESQSGVFV